MFQTIISGWTDETNPLLDSFELKVKDVDNIKKTASLIKKIEKSKVKKSEVYLNGS